MANHTSPASIQQIFFAAKKSPKVADRILQLHKKIIAQKGEPDSTPPAVYLTFGELAEKADVPETTLRRLFRKHDIHGTKVGSREAFSTAMAGRVRDWTFNLYLASTYRALIGIDANPEKNAAFEARMNEYQEKAAVALHRIKHHQQTVQKITNK